jgi:hypothetical protein
MIKSTIKRLETLLKGSKDFSLTEKKAMEREDKNNDTGEQK